MTYFRDPKTAATMDLFDEFSAIVDKHRVAEARDLQALLGEVSKYMRSVGYDLNLRESFLEKDVRASDGVRMTGQLVITERAENVAKAETPEQVKRWVQTALQVYSRVRPMGEDTWLVELGE